MLKVYSIKGLLDISKDIGLQRCRGKKITDCAKSRVPFRSHLEIQSLSLILFVSNIILN